MSYNIPVASPVLACVTEPRPRCVFGLVVPPAMRNLRNIGSEPEGCVSSGFPLVFLYLSGLICSNYLMFSELCPLVFEWML